MVRKAKREDLSRVAEILVFNNRLNFLPIFKDEYFSFGELQVVSLIDNYYGKPEILEGTYVYDDGLIRGFFTMGGTEIRKFYVDTFFQNRGIGAVMMDYALNRCGADRLWVVEKNHRGIAFYRRHGFTLSGEKMLEEGSDEYLVEMVRR